MTEIRYRLTFKDGTHSAWTTNKAFIEENAKFFRAEIETWEVKFS